MPPHNLTTVTLKLIKYQVPIYTIEFDNKRLSLSTMTEFGSHQGESIMDNPQSYDHYMSKWITYGY